MRIFIFSHTLPPPAAKACGYSGPVFGGWVGAMIDGLCKYDPTIEFFVLCLDSRPCDVQIGNVHYATFGLRHKRTQYFKKIPLWIQREAQQAIRNFNPDIIQIQGTEFFYGRMDDAVYCGKPVIVVMQGVISALHPYFNGCISESEVGFAKYVPRYFRYGSTIFSRQSEWRNQLAVQEQEIFRRRYLFVGRTDFDRACIEFYNPKARYYHVDETLRPEFYTINRCTDSVRQHSIFCGGAAGYPLKGAHLLIHAVSSLKRIYPDVKLRIAGATQLRENRTLKETLRDYSYSCYLRRLIKRLDVRPQIVCLPYLTASDVADELKRAHVFVLPSYCENSPNSLGEAMLAGTPAIAAFTGGVPSIMEHGKEGLLVPTGDHCAFTAAIRNVFDRVDDAVMRASVARERAFRTYDAEKNAKMMFSVYEEVLA